METILNILFNPITLIIFGLIAALGFMASPYEVKFDEGDEE